MRTEITAEQAYQEDLIEAAYRTSGNPIFVARADAMMRTFETDSQPSTSTESGTQQPEQPEARDNVDLRDRWGLIEDLDPRIVQTRAALRDANRR